MKNFLVRSLIGTAVVLAVGAEGYAATASVTKTFSSVEKNAADAALNAADSITLPTVTVTPGGTGYLDGEKVKISLSGGSLRAASLGTIGATSGANIINCTDSAGGGDILRLTLAEVSGNTATYTVTRLRSEASVANARCAFANIGVLKSSLASGTTYVNFSYSAESVSGTQIDVLRWTSEGNPAAPINAHVAASQFAFETSSPLSVSNSRSLNQTQTGWIRTTTGPTISSSLVVSRAVATADNSSTTKTTLSLLAKVGGSAIEPITGATGVSTTGATLDITHTGDFSFLDNNGNGCSAADLSSGWAQLTSARTATISADCRTITTTGSGAADATETLTFIVGKTAGDDYVTSSTGTLNGVRQIPVQTITSTAKWTLADGSTVTRSSAASWSISSWSNDIPYMPYGAGISRIVYVTNRSSTANVTISAVNEAGTSCSSTRFPTVSARGGTVTSISAAMDAGIEACFGAGWTGKARFTVTVAVAPQTEDTIRHGIVRGYAGNSATAVDADTGLATTADTVGAINALTMGNATYLQQSNSTVSRARSLVDIYSAYNVNGNRVQVINPSNGR